MKKKEIFTFTAPNGVEVTAIVIDLVAVEVTPGLTIDRWLCYAQNRLFTYEESKDRWDNDTITHKYDRVLVDYAILPDYDDMLEAEQQKFDDDCYEALSSIGDTEF